jgi:lipopolysaccharide export system protein LptA
MTNQKGATLYNLRIAIFAFSVLVLAPFSAFAQGSEAAFGGLKHDSSQAVQATADKLVIDQSDGSALFSGNVVIGQGEMRITAPSVRILYTNPDDGSARKIARVIATGGAVIVNGEEAAEAETADYDVQASKITMTGKAILTQKSSAMSADRIFIDLEKGTAVMDGNVRSLLQAGDGG